MKICKSGLHKYSKDKRHCPECRKISNAKWYAENTEHQKTNNANWKLENPDYHTKWRADNSERQKVNQARWKAENADRYNAIQARWQAENADRYRANKARWLKQNPGKVNAWNAKRRAAKLQATPKWLTKEQLKQIERYYLAAAWVQEILEDKIEVDHIHPLQGENICGLHVPWNLQLLTKTANSSKGNSFENKSKQPQEGEI